MTWIFRLKHWQIFLILFGGPWILSSIFSLINQFTNIDTIINSINEIFSIIRIVFYFGWLFILGNLLNNKLPKEIKYSKIFFNVNLIIVFLSLMVVYYQDLLKVINITITIPYVNPMTINTYGIIIMMYAFHFIAKEIVIIERNSKPPFGAHIQEFFLIWFLPIGIWFIQPRISKIFKE